MGLAHRSLSIAFWPGALIPWPWTFVVAEATRNDLRRMYGSKQSLQKSNDAGKYFNRAIRRSLRMAHYLVPHRTDGVVVAAHCVSVGMGLLMMHVRIEINSTGASDMGKYVLGWVLGVPVVVLVIVYFVFN